MKVESPQRPLLTSTSDSLPTLLHLIRLQQHSSGLWPRQISRSVSLYKHNFFLNIFVSLMPHFIWSICIWFLSVECEGALCGVSDTSDGEVPQPGCKPLTSPSVSSDEYLHIDITQCTFDWGWTTYWTCYLLNISQFPQNYIELKNYLNKWHRLSIYLPYQVLTTIRSLGWIALSLSLISAHEYLSDIGKQCDVAELL